MLVGEGARIAGQRWQGEGGGDSGGDGGGIAADAEEVTVEMGAVAGAAHAVSAVEPVATTRPVWQQVPKSRVQSAGPGADGALSISEAGADV